jgi:hypothetical protein
MVHKHYYDKLSLLIGSTHMPQKKKSENIRPHFFFNAILKMGMENKHYGISFEVATYHKLSYIYKNLPMSFVFILKF